MRTHDHDEPPVAGLIDPARPEQAIAATDAACYNWGRWGDDDARGTLNFLVTSSITAGPGTGGPRRTW